MKAKKILSAILSSVFLSSLLSVLTVNASVTENVTEFGLGSIPVTYEEEQQYSSQFNNVVRVDYSDVQLATSVDLSTSNYFPPIGNQGSISSCGAWATTYYQYTYEANKFNNITTTANNAYSPTWTYNLINSGFDGGSRYFHTYQVLELQGALHISEQPYNVDNYSFEWSTNTTAMINALRTRLANYSTISINTSSNQITHVNDSQLAEIKRLLCAEKVLLVNLYANPNLSNWSFKEISSGGEDGDIAAYRASESNTGHAMVIVGYDNNITCDINGNGTIEATERGAFKVANSWGANWKNDGYIWVMYDALNKTSANTTNNWETNENGERISIFEFSIQNQNDFHYIEVENKIINLVGLLELNTLYRNQLSLYTGKNSASDTIYDYTRNTEIQRTCPFSGTIVLDYLDCDDYILDNLSENWYVKIYDSITNGSITSEVKYKIVDNKQNVVKDFGVISPAINNGGTVNKYCQINLQLGDINYDGSLSQSDVDLIQNYLAKAVRFSDLQCTLADYDQNGTIDINDAVYILNEIA